MVSILLALSVLTGLTGEWRTFTNTNYVNDIAGSDSVLYLATRGGLQTFTIANTTFRDAYTNASGLPVNDLRCCVEDRAGLIWIGTVGGGLVVFDPSDGKLCSYPTDFLPLTVTCLGISGDTILLGSDNGAFVIATQGTGLDFDDDQITQFQAPRILSNTVMSVGTAGGSLWIGTNVGANRIARSLDSIWTYLHPLGDSIKSVIEYHGAAHLATERGIIRFTGTGFDTLTVYPQSHSVQRMVAWRDTFYVALEAGLWRLNGSGMETVWAGDARTVFARSDLWLGFGGLVEVGYGLDRIQPDGWQSSFAAIGLASNNIASAIVDSSGGIYACHYLTQWGFTKISHRNADGAWEWLQDTILNARSMARDSRNRIWFGHFAMDGGVSVYDPSDSTWQSIQWGSSDFRNVVCAFGIDRQDTKWVFSQAGTIIAIDSTGQQEVFTVSGIQAGSDAGYDFAFDRQGRAWLGALNGIGMIDTRGTMHDRSDDSIVFITTGTNVPGVAVDQANRVWFGTSQGAGVLENGSLRYYTTANSDILGDEVSRVRVDSWGNVWFLTDKGLSVFDPANRRWSKSDINRGLIPNLKQRAGFYAWLDLDEAHNSVLVGTMAGLSQFRYQVLAESTARHVAIYPNPFIQGVSTRVVFDSLPEQALVQIFTLSGEHVADIAAQRNPLRGGWEATWTPERVASGLYLAVVWADSQRSVYRFAVVK
jgi:ligand-binding sensor domain-containing protein